MGVFAAAASRARESSAPPRIVIPGNTSFDGPGREPAAFEPIEVDADEPPEFVALAFELLMSDATVFPFEAVESPVADAPTLPFVPGSVPGKERLGCGEIANWPRASPAGMTAG